MNEQWFGSNLLRGVMLLAAAYWGRQRQGSSRTWPVAAGIGLVLIATEIAVLLSTQTALLASVADLLEFAFVLVPIAVGAAFAVSLRAARILAGESAGLESRPEADSRHAAVVRRRLAFAGTWLILNAPPVLPFIALLMRWQWQPSDLPRGGDLPITIAILGTLVTSLVAAVPALLAAGLAALRLLFHPVSRQASWPFSPTRGRALALAATTVIAATGLILSLASVPLMRDEAKRWVTAVRESSMMH